MSKEEGRFKAASGEQGWVAERPGPFLFPEGSLTLGALVAAAFQKTAEGEGLHLSGIKSGVRPFPHQLEAIEKLHAKDGNILLSHPVGSGKTLSSILAFESLRDKGKAARALVVVPASLRTNYLDNGVKKFTTGTGAVFGNAAEISQGTHVSPEKPDEGARYHIVSYDMFRKDPKKYIEASKADTVIYDELHKAKTEGALTTKAIREARPFHKNFIGMTGSIVSNTPADIVPLVDAMTEGKHVLGNKTSFESRFIIVDPKTGTKQLHNERVLKGLIAPYVHHVDPTQLAAHTKAPKKVVEEVKVEMSPYQTELYRYITKTLDPITRLKFMAGASRLNNADVNEVFAKLLRLRQLSNSVHTIDKATTVDTTFEHSPKVKKLLDDVEEHLKETPDGQVVIHTNMIHGGVDVLQAGLRQRGIDHGLFIGKGNEGVNEKTRQEGVKEYQAGKKRVMVISAAGAEGLDLPNTTMMAMLDGHFNPEKINQAEARGIRAGGQAHRPEEKRQVIVRRYMSVLPKKDAGRLAEVVRDTLSAISPAAMMERMKDPNAPVFINPFKRQKSTDEWVYDVAKGKATLNQLMHQHMKTAEEEVVPTTWEELEESTGLSKQADWKRVVNQFGDKNPALFKALVGAGAGAGYGTLLSPLLTQQTKDQKKDDPGKRLRRSLGGIAGGAVAGGTIGTLLGRGVNPVAVVYPLTMPAATSPFLGAMAADMIAAPKTKIGPELQEAAGHKGPLYTEKQLFEKYWDKFGPRIEREGVGAPITEEEAPFIAALREVYEKGPKHDTLTRRMHEVGKKGIVTSPPRSKPWMEHGGAIAMGLIPTALAAGAYLGAKPLAKKLVDKAFDPKSRIHSFAVEKLIQHGVPYQVINEARQNPEAMGALKGLAQEFVSPLLQNTLKQYATSTALAAVPTAAMGAIMAGAADRELYRDPHITVANKTEARKRSKFTDEQLSMLLRGLPVEEVKVKQHYIK